jgi:hypothetical protein
MKTFVMILYHLVVVIIFRLNFILFVVGSFSIGIRIIHVQVVRVAINPHPIRFEEQYNGFVGLAVKVNFTL